MITRLIVRAPNWLGDAVMALPALAGVRRHFASAQVIIAARPSIAPLFRLPIEARPDDVVTLEGNDEGRALRAIGADAILLLTNSFGSAWQARRSGIHERWGYAAAGRSPLLTRAVRRPRRVLHQSDYYRELVRGLGVDVTDDPPRVAIDDRLLARGDAVLAAAGVDADHAPMVGFAPGAAYGRAKQWPPARVAEVIVRLAARGARSAIVGAASDRDTARAIESAMPADVRVINLVGRTDLAQLVGVIARCRVFVSNDSGAMHVAAAAGVPVTAIFGPTDERVTSPAGVHDLIVRDVFCRPCMLRECPIDHRCMKRIGVDDVLAAIERRLTAPE